MRGIKKNINEEKKRQTESIDFLVGLGLLDKSNRQSGASLREKGVHVLVVDDSLTIRNEMKILLDRIGVTSQYVKDGNEALELLRKGSIFDLIFCDVHMPNLNGTELLRIVFEDNNIPRIPMVMLTTESGVEEVMKGKRYGAAAWILKPTSLEILRKVMDKLLC